MVSVVILGIAQDGGIPHFMCKCANCLSTNKKTRMVSSIGIIGATKAIIIDATPDLPKQFNLFNKFLSEKNLKLDGILLTHLHVGHYTGLIYLGKESVHSQNFPLYVTKENYSFLKYNKPFSYLFSRNEIKEQVIEPRKKIQFDDEFSIIPFEVPHRNEDGNTIGLEILNEKKSRKGLYIPDIDYLTPEVENKIKQSDKVLLDGTFYTQTELMRQENIPHPPIIDTITKFGSQTVDKFYFIHINHSNPVLDQNSPEYKKIKEINYNLASEGDQFIL